MLNGDAMNSAREHEEAAMEIAEDAKRWPLGSKQYDSRVKVAQIYATLALASATQEAGHR